MCRATTAANTVMAASAATAANAVMAASAATAANAVMAANAATAANAVMAASAAAGRRCALAVAAALPGGVARPGRMDSQAHPESVAATDAAPVAVEAGLRLRCRAAVGARRADVARRA